MGYEIKYKFNKMKDGAYDKSTEEEGSIKVGDPFEDISTELLAGRVMALMARRNIWVKDIEIYELAKKSVAFKEAEDGIVIRNKKFKFDDSPVVCEGKEIVETPSKPQQKQISSQASSQPASQISAPAANLAAPIRYEVHIKTDPVWVDLVKKAAPTLALTIGKRYPIFKEALGPERVGMIYEIRDDNGKIQSVIDKLFAPQSTLQNDGVDNGLTDAGLNWGSVVPEEIKDIRKKG